MATGPYGNRAIGQQGHTATGADGKQCTGGQVGECTSRMSLPERSAVMTRVQGGCSRARASWGCRAPLIWRVRRKGISSGIGNTCTAVPKEYLHHHQLDIVSQEIPHFLYIACSPSFCSFVCLFLLLFMSIKSCFTPPASFCFHEYIVMFHTPSITGEGLIPAVVSQDN